LPIYDGCDLLFIAWVGQISYAPHLYTTSRNLRIFDRRKQRSRCLGTLFTNSVPQILIFFSASLKLLSSPRHCPARVLAIASVRLAVALSSPSALVLAVTSVRLHAVTSSPPTARVLAIADITALCCCYRLVIVAHFLHHIPQPPNF
jgi:hypothetical protein